MKASLMAMVLASVAAFGQAAQAPPPASEPMRVYTNPELHLTFSYPAELTPRDAATVLGAERRMIYGADAATDADHPRDMCAKVLLAVGANNAGSGATSWARVGLFEVDARCLPAQVLRNKKAMDLTLTNLVRQGTTEMGMMPIEPPMFYDLEGQRMHFSAGQGTPVMTADLQTGEEQVIGAAAVAVNGHVLGWVIEANDAALFNRLLGSQVDFGGGKAQRLFPARVQ
jgi:hypothetical protein